MEHKSNSDTDCNWNASQRLRKRDWKSRKSVDERGLSKLLHYKDIQNTEKGSGDLNRLAITRIRCEILARNKNMTKFKIGP